MTTLPTAAPPLSLQLVNLSAALMLLFAFAMIAQRRVRSLVTLFACQGLTLTTAIAVVAYTTAQPHLWVSFAVTLSLKVVIIPWFLLRAIKRLDVWWDRETLINIPVTMLVALSLVIAAFYVAAPLAALSTSLARGALGIALAALLLSLLMMITRAKAIPQIIGFLSLENALLFAATSATHGMPMVVELGIALDVLVGILIIGVFLFQIREQFDRLDWPSEVGSE